MTYDYLIVGSGLFGSIIIFGIITGIRYTENKPVYELSFGKDKCWTSEIAETSEEIFELLNTQDVNLSEVRDSCINYFNLHPWERQEYLDFRKDDPVIYKIITLLKN